MMVIPHVNMTSRMKSIFENSLMSITVLTIKSTYWAVLSNRRSQKNMWAQSSTTTSEAKILSVNISVPSWFRNTIKMMQATFKPIVARSAKFDPDLK